MQENPNFQIKKSRICCIGFPVCCLYLGSSDFIAELENKESITHLVAFLWRLAKATVFATHFPLIS